MWNLSGTKRLGLESMRPALFVQQILIDTLDLEISPMHPLALG